MSKTQFTRPTATNYMGKPWILDVDAAGNVTVRAQGAKNRGGLPVFSTDTEAQASFLVVTHCKLARDGSGIYTLNRPPQSVDELADVAELFASTRARMVANSKWDDLR